MTGGCATAIVSMVGLALGILAANTVRIRTDLFGGLVLLVMSGLMVVRCPICRWSTSSAEAGR